MWFSTLASSIGQPPLVAPQNVNTIINIKIYNLITENILDSLFNDILIILLIYSSFIIANKICNINIQMNLEHFFIYLLFIHKK